MDLLLLGAGMGIVGGLIPSPLHMLALTQVAFHRWGRAILILLGPPLVIDGALLGAILAFYRFIPHGIAHNVAYVGGVVLIGFAVWALLESRHKTPEEMAASAHVTQATVWVAALAEVTAPGTWIYWLTVAGPILSEGRQHGYWRVVPFFAGGLGGYYGAAIFAVWLMAWGASLHRGLRNRLFLVANSLLLVMGVSYLVRAYLMR